ncbi:hypothetical protein COV82_02230 [Candidatus Peregrinibacteria bacterium CG11_big_fil_rev_8_21_14_0_20_46_8]|nr:MAG: hypothetical protein COV82_02230 [Candidatus Peregrinibacteria bacterium CG11_big_fil_rev_8_21_14_0_20_46_8]
MSPKLYSGPHQTAIEAYATAQCVPQLTAPDAVLTEPLYPEVLQGVIELHLDAGVRTVVTHTFPERAVLNHGHVTQEKIDDFRNRLGKKVSIARNAITARRLTNDAKISISLGPKGDCYKPEEAPDRHSAQEFHQHQFAAAAEHEPHFVLSETVNTIEEAIGIALAAKNHRVPGTRRKQAVPTLISFVIDHNGNLLSGESPLEAIHAIDRASDRLPIGYGFNCCPVEGLALALAQVRSKIDRVISAAPNASSFPVDQLDGVGTTTGHIRGLVDSRGMSRFLAGIAQRYDLQYISGCCGFDPNHICQIGTCITTNDTQEELPDTDWSRLLAAA